MLGRHSLLKAGRWNLTGILICLVGILWSLVTSLGGADIAWIIGLIVPAMLYYSAPDMPA